MAEPALVLTPTARLARSLARRLAEARAAEGALAWLPPRILSFSAWLAALREQYFLDSDDRRMPISAPQARLLWQAQIDMDVFIGEPQVAELAEGAWRRIHEYGLRHPATWQPLELSEDSRRFRDWAQRYARACEERGLVDEWAFAAELPELIAGGRVTAPATLTLTGFDLPMTPLQARIVEALAAAGTAVERSDAAGPETAPDRVRQALEPRAELAAAARWARQLLEDGRARQIAVVVPDLAGRLGDVERTFRAVFDPPGARLLGQAPAAWHVSLGAPLRQWPLVADALAILELAEDRVAQAAARRLLASPFVRGWSAEPAPRDRAAAWLIREAPWEITPGELQHAAGQAAAREFAGCVDAWRARRADARGAAWPSVWAARFQEELSAFGFGAGRALDSREYQVLQRWHDLLEEFCALDVMTDRPLPRARALTLLRERAAATVFREQNPGVPVEILGVEEALGSRFDAVWLTTLDNEHWPAAPRRHPLIPAALQTAIPGSTPEGALAHARQTLQGLYRTAPLVTGSFSTGSADEERHPTALVGDLPIELIEPAEFIAPAPLAAAVDDWRAPALAPGAAGGGTAPLARQSTCPFRAFAERRLGAVDLTPRRPGLDAAQRGEVIHAALERLWSDLDGRAALAALDESALAARIAAAVDAAIAQFTARFRLILTPAGTELERRRTSAVVGHWLALELERGEFTVEAREFPVAMQFAGLTLRGKIDRIDRLANGSRLLIDYKTGRNSRNSWLPEARIADPQLPAYAVSMEPPPDAIAFARIRPEDLRFDGLCREDAATPGVVALARAGRAFKGLDDWPELLTDWRTRLEALARGFREGRAAVDPREPSACTHCHLHAFCRIFERAPMAPDNGQDPDEASDAAGA